MIMNTECIQTKGPNKGWSISCGVEDIPSSIKAEAIAILMALAIILTGSKVKSVQTVKYTSMYTNRSQTNKNILQRRDDSKLKIFRFEFQLTQ